MSRSAVKVMAYVIGVMLCAAMLMRAQRWTASDPMEHWGSNLRGPHKSVGSTPVPLDSWIYAAFERLIAWGYADRAFLDLRPWTRWNCVEMLAGMEEQFDQYVNEPDARGLFAALRAEFEPDYRAGIEEGHKFHGEIDSAYVRTLGISGMPINDSFHFGQTLINDSGRPYEEGVNQIAGFSGRVEYGRFSLSIRGEYQYAPGAPPYSSSVRQAISIMDDSPVQPARAISSTSTFRLLDANVAVNMLGNVISIGKSELWWGPGEGGAFAYSDNAEPIYMLRIARAEPWNIPWLSRALGPMRYEFFLGPLEGHSSPPGPWIQGQKISFKPSVNLEFGVSRTIVFAGRGHVPLTFGSFWNSFTSFDNVPLEVKFSRNDPGARYSSMDFSYRFPYVRDWVTLYADAMAHDDVSPLAAPRRAAFRPGVYFARVPHAHRLALRAEAAYTDFPTAASHGGQFFFFENAYHDAYTNKEVILGDAVGREGMSFQTWLTTHLSAKEQIRFAYRHAKSASDFVPGGTTQNEFSARLVRRLRPNFELNAFAQIELWKAPILAEGLRADLVTGVQMTYFPISAHLAK